MIHRRDAESAEKTCDQLILWMGTEKRDGVAQGQARMRIGWRSCAAAIGRVNASKSFTRVKSIIRLANRSSIGRGRPATRGRVWASTQLNQTGTAARELAPSRYHFLRLGESP